MLHLNTIGHVGQDAKIKHIDRGGVVCSFSLACKTYTRGEYVTTWIDVSIFGKRAESLVGKLTKGAHIAAVGTGYLRKTDRGSYLQMRAEEIVMLDKRTKTEDAGGYSDDSIPF